MKKTFTLLLVLLTTAVSSFAQYYYFIPSTGSTDPYYASVSGSFATVLGTDRTNTADEKDEVLSSIQTIPFSFDFGGTGYDKYIASDNGYITFDLTATTSNSANESLPSASAPTKAIMAFWDNLEFEQNGQYLFAIVSETVGTAPNRAHIIKWFQANHVDRSAELNELYYFGLVLHEQGGFEIIHEGTYVPSTGGKNITESGTIGYNLSGTDGVTVDGPSALFPTAVSSNMADDKVYSFFVGPQNAVNIGITGTNVPKIANAAASASVPISTTVRNYGSTTITSVDVSYTVNGGTPVTDTYTTNLAPGASAEFQQVTMWTPSGAGDYTIAITATPTGLTDETLENNSSTETVQVVAEVVQRTPLYEVFTSSTCGPCTPGNANFHNVISGKEDECTFIKYQQNFPGTGDPYATETSVARRGFYAVSSIPRMEIDGGWDKNASSFNSSLHTEARDLTENFSVITLNATFDKWAQEVSTDISISSSASLENISVYAAIIETYTENNFKTNGEREFSNVFKRFMSGAEGELISITKGTDLSKNYSTVFWGDYRLPNNGASSSWIDNDTEHSVEDFSNLKVLVWVQDNATKRVLQSAYATETALSIDELKNELNVNVYPNPTTGISFVTIDLKQASEVTFTLTNTAGQVVETKTMNTINAGENNLTLDLSTYNNGVYFLTIQTAEGTSTKKIVVSK